MRSHRNIALKLGHVWHGPVWAISWESHVIWGIRVPAQSWSTSQLADLLRLGAGLEQFHDGWGGHFKHNHSWQTNNFQCNQTHTSLIISPYPEMNPIRLRNYAREIEIILWWYTGTESPQIHTIASGSTWTNKADTSSAATKFVHPGLSESIQLSNIIQDGVLDCHYFPHSTSLKQQHPKAK